MEYSLEVLVGKGLQVIIGNVLEVNIVMHLFTFRSIQHFIFNRLILRDEQFCNTVLQSFRSDVGTHEICLSFTARQVSLDIHSPLWLIQLTRLGAHHPLTQKMCYSTYSLKVSYYSI